MEIDKIYEMDCITGMKQLPDKSVSVILTSVPFKDEDVEGDYWEFMDRFMDEVFRVTRDYAVIFQSSTKLWEMCRRYKRPFHVAIWNKINLMLYCRKYTPIFIYDCGANYNLNKELYADVFPYAVKRNSMRKHKYEDPLFLYTDLLKKFKNVITVLDPFMGSGTTAVACKNLGLNYIGFEIDKENCEISIERLKQGNISTYNVACAPLKEGEK